MGPIGHIMGRNGRMQMPLFPIIEGTTAIFSHPEFGKLIVEKENHMLLLLPTDHTHKYIRVISFYKDIHTGRTEMQETTFSEQDTIIPMKFIVGPEAMFRIRITHTDFRTVKRVSFQFDNLGKPF